MVTALDRFKEIKKEEEEAAMYTPSSLTAKQQAYVFGVFGVVASCFYIANMTIWILPLFLATVTIVECFSKEDSLNVSLLAYLFQKNIIKF